LRQLAATTTVMAKGQFDVIINGSQRGDEVGAMAKALAVFRDNGRALRRAEQERLKVRDQNEADKRLMLAAVAGSFERDIVTVAATISNSTDALKRLAQAMTSSAEESARYTNAAAQIIQESTKNALGVAGAVEELSACINEIGNQVGNASLIVAEATERAD